MEFIIGAIIGIVIFMANCGLSLLNIIGGKPNWLETTQGIAAIRNGGRFFASISQTFRITNWQSRCIVQYTREYKMLLGQYRCQRKCLMQALNSNKRTPFWFGQYEDIRYCRLELVRIRAAYYQPVKIQP